MIKSYIKVRKHTTVCHQHKYENLYYDDALLNLSVAYRYINSAVPILTLVALHNLIQLIPKLPPQSEHIIDDHLGLISLMPMQNQ